MPDLPSWTARAPRILTALKQPGPELLDRAAVERLFGLSARQANRIMRACTGAYATGRSVLVTRQSLSAFVEQRVNLATATAEAARRERLGDLLADARQEARHRSIVIPVKPEAFSRTFDNLPAGVRLEPGRLSVEFHSPMDLLEKLFELVQAFSNDSGRLDEFVGEAEAVRQEPES